TTIVLIALTNFTSVVPPMLFSRLMQGLLMQGLRQAPAVERQKNDVKHQYRQEVEQQRISDEGEVAANGNNPKVDHVLHAKGGQDQSRSQKSDFTGCHELHPLRCELYSCSHTLNRFTPRNWNETLRVACDDALITAWICPRIAYGNSPRALQ